MPWRSPRSYTSVDQVRQADRFTQSFKTNYPFPSFAMCQNSCVPGRRIHCLAIAVSEVLFSQSWCSQSFYVQRITACLLLSQQQLEWQFSWMTPFSSHLSSSPLCRCGLVASGEVNHPNSLCPLTGHARKKQNAHGMAGIELTFLIAARISTSPFLGFSCFDHFGCKVTLKNSLQQI